MPVPAAASEQLLHPAMLWSPFFIAMPVLSFGGLLLCIAVCAERRHAMLCCHWLVFQCCTAVWLVWYGLGFVGLAAVVACLLSQYDHVPWPPMFVLGKVVSTFHALLGMLCSVPPGTLRSFDAPCQWARSQKMQRAGKGHRGQGCL